ncbi:MAG: bifunctional hydroxymethylpyrimidine kinase/phosphomethylpyrimidine kinase, partial [Novosphingobium sp.]
DGDMVEDRLVVPGCEPVVWSAPRIDTRHKHGNGCTLSSAKATGLGAGLGLEEAVAQGREFVRAALGAAPGYGNGHGPMGHHAVRQAGRKAPGRS